MTTIFTLIESGSTGPARVRLVKYATLHPNDGHAAFLMGLTYHSERRYAKAMPHFERARQFAPNYAPAAHFLGWCRFYLGDLDGAASSFNDHLATDPDEADSHFALGLIALEHDDTAEAESRFQCAIDLQRTNPHRMRELAKALVRLAEVRTRQDQFTDAETLLLEAISVYPDHYEAHYRLARILQRRGETERADDAMEEFRAVYDRMRPELPQYRNR